MRILLLAALVALGFFALALLGVFLTWRRQELRIRRDREWAYSRWGLRP